MASKSNTKVCRSLVESTRIVHLFSSTGVERRWAPRISLLLDVPVDKSERISSYMCKSCAHRVESLEKAVKDLAVFRAMAQCSLERVTGLLKRAKETSSNIGVSPDTIKELHLYTSNKKEHKFHFSISYSL